jgi:hypothetical protein
MKNNCEDLKLLNAALADETWESFQARLRTQTTATLRSSKRRRALFTFSAQLAALLAVIAAAWFNLGPRAHVASRNQAQAILQSHSQASAPPSSRNPDSYITQEEMIAMFPKDTCVLAEVNGQTELVFFDSTKARDGFDADHL